LLRDVREADIDSLRISVLGAGRMGRQILAEIAHSDHCVLGGVWVRPGSELLGIDMSRFAGASAKGVVASCDIDAALKGSDVAIDFSLPEAWPAVLNATLVSNIALVCGVSGLSHDDLHAMREAARSIPLFYDRNMSIGVAVMRHLVRQAGALLDSDFSATIHYTHHAQKRDAPSGTALLLGETLARSRGQDFAQVMRYKPAEAALRGDPGDIVFHVVREGTHPGRHTLTLQSKAEQLAITHEVNDRRVFAIGALRAARWLSGKPAGLYDMQHLLAAAP
jgi:4-hydroxy-tetrahydrodipicolinate reductase